MTVFKGTPGKWFTTDEYSGGIYSEFLVDKAKNDPLYKLENGEIAQCWADLIDGKYTSDEECVANSKLMAASPELLELVLVMKSNFEKSLEHSSLSEDDQKTYQKILEVIKKATE